MSPSPSFPASNIIVRAAFHYDMADGYIFAWSLAPLALDLTTCAGHHLGCGRRLLVSSSSRGALIVTETCALSLLSSQTHTQLAQARQRDRTVTSTGIWHRRSGDFAPHGQHSRLHVPRNQVTFIGTFVSSFPALFCSACRLAGLDLRVETRHVVDGPRR
jgi:hypothetical protein